MPLCFVYPLYAIRKRPTPRQQHKGGSQGLPRKASSTKRKGLHRKFPRQGDSSNGELPTVDVGPITRQFLTRADGFFGGPDYLTLSNELIRRQVAERAMWAASFDCIEVFYNRTRRFSTLGYKSPMQFLEDWRMAQHDGNLVA